MNRLASLPVLAVAASVFSGLAPRAQAQLGSTERTAGTLDSPADPRFHDVTGDGLLDVLLFSEVGSGLALSVASAVTATEYTLPEVALELEGTVEDSAYLATDIDGDGDTDLWYATRQGPPVTLPLAVTSYLNDGQGGFSVGGSWTGIGTVPIALASLDVDGDGLADLVVSTELSNDGFFPGQPGGGLGAYQRFFSGNLAHGQLALGDVDGDGTPEIVAASALLPGASQPQTVVYENTGSFPIDPSSGTVVTSGQAGARVSLADLDADGDADLLVTAGMFATQSLLFESQAGAFQDLGAVMANLAILTSGVDLADLDGDGDEDLIFRRAVLGLRWAENLGGLVFGAEVDLSLDLPFPSDFADLDGDGLQEFLLLTTGFDGTLLWIRGTEMQAGGVTPGALEVALSDFPGRENPLAAADLDGDGREDLVLLWSPPAGFGPFTDEHEIGWKRALGNGEFGLTEPIAGVGDSPFQDPPLAGDFDGDGDADVVYVDRPGSRIRLLRGDGAGGFPGQVIDTPVPFPVIEAIAASLNADGALDLVLQGEDGLTAVAMLGTPSGVFGVGATSTGATVTFERTVAVDVNGDLLDDLLFVLGARVELALQVPGGGFAPRALVADATGLPLIGDLVLPSGLDFDGDGQMDLLVPVGSAVYGASGFGDGTFGALQVLVQDGGPKIRRLLPARVDQDGRADLVMRNGESGSPHQWARNLGGGSFAPFEQAAGPNLSVARSVVLVDADGDGDQDLVSSAFNGFLVYTENLANGPLGVSYCGPAVVNSTGEPGTLAAFGSPDPSANALDLRASGLPPGQFGFFLVGPTQGLVSSVPSSQGTLCLGGAIGRLNRPGEIQFSGATGTFALPVDLNAIPTPLGDVPVLVGETWNFQAWYRDTDTSGSPTSNFTDGLEVTF